MSSDKKKKAWAENGLEDWGAYMAAKKEKLEDQFAEAAKKEFQDATSLFSGVAIFVNGYTNPCADELKRLMMAHGGIYHHYMRPGITTHIIASNLPYSKITAYRKSQNPLPICKPEWITDSLEAQKLLDWRNYVLYSNCTETQPQLRFSAKTNTVSKVGAKVWRAEQAAPPPIDGPKIVGGPRSTGDAEFLTEFYNNSRLHHISTMGTTFKNYVSELRAKSDGTFPGLERLRVEHPASGAVLADSDEDLADPSRAEAANRNVIMHIDMDCFFVSVGLRNRPELRGVPVAVTHARGNGCAEKAERELGSMSEIASCSYEARKAGVKNGMFLGQALKLCPNLKTMNYDFDGYREVSYALYDTVASYTLLIEAVSCDEMYADVSRVLAESGLNPLKFAKMIRHEIRGKTGCPVSTGFGSNKLQARLATRMAKPDGQFYLDSGRFREHVGPTNVRDLPGVGYATTQQLSRLNVRTCSDLYEISLPVLRKEFGKKSGEILYNMCRGIDDSKLTVEHVRKSVSAEVNYGIRFGNGEEAEDFLRKLSREVCTRLQKANSKGRSVTLKLMVRAKDAPKETLKFMGHGVCDSFTKSKNFIASVDDPAIVSREVIALWTQMQQPYDDIRGIGIQISRLESTRPNPGSLMQFVKKSREAPVRKDENERRKRSLANNDRQQVASGKGAVTKADRDIDKNHSDPSWFGDYDESVLKELPEDIRKEILGRAEQPKPDSKGTALRQTHQENYFKHAKATSGKPTTAKMPPIEEIDMAVLVELPEDIRNEIMNEYRSGRRDKDQDTEQIGAGESAAAPKRNDGSGNTEQLEKDANLSFSQVDPDFLAALPEDMRTDVQMYCMVKKKEQSSKVKKAAPETTVKNRNSTKAPKRKASKSTNKIARVTKDSLRARQVVDNELKNEPVPKGRDRTTGGFLESELNEDREMGGTLEQREEIISHHSGFTGKKARTEEQQMVTRLVNYLFTLPLQQVKMQIQTWITKSERVNEIDLLSLATFLSMLPRKKRLEDLHILLKTMHRCITKTGSCAWHETYGKTVSHVQHYMQIEYNSKMMLPTIKCDCETNAIV